MKRRMLWILFAGIVVGLALSGLYRHFVTNQIMDGGDGMENPDAAFLLDGDHTYVDNSVLWPVLEGTWESADGRWQAVIDEEDGIVLCEDGETVLTSPLDFTYLQPGKVAWTELLLDRCGLVAPDGTALGTIKAFSHDAAEDEGSGTLTLTRMRSDDSEETVVLQKREP